MEGVGKTWEVARESADGDYCHFDYLTVEDEDDNDVDDDDDDWGLACVRSPLRFSQFFVKRRRLGFFNNAQPWRVEYGDDYDEQNDHWSEYQKTNNLFPYCQQLLDLGD